MGDNYTRIVQDNLNQLYQNLPADLAGNLLARQENNRFIFNAFGEKCIIEPNGIQMGEKEHASILGILISLYALHARPDICIVEPFNAFKAFPDSMPYAGAFTTHTEQILVPFVTRINASRATIIEKLNGGDAPPGTGGDFSFMLYPLPKIALCYVFYEADDDFPASATCLYSNNADLFLPVDALADVGEYCSKTILELIR